jgi:hypothetical protein
VKVDINKFTFYDWIKKRVKSTHPRNRYKIFLKTIQKAIAWSEAKNMALITKHSASILSS